MDYICITDIAKQKNPIELKDVVKNWIRNRNNLEYLELWEKLNNLDFKWVKFDFILQEVVIMSPSQWIELIDAKGIITKNRANGGTFAQYDIAIKFVSLVSVELYLVKELQRPKADELKLIVWTAKRELFKINYRIHTYAIKNNFIPTEVIPKQTSIIYADEADVSNVAMFCLTAKMWIEQNPDLKGKIRDYVSINELVCISNMESLNAVFIGQDIVQC